MINVIKPYFAKSQSPRNHNIERFISDGQRMRTGIGGGWSGRRSELIMAMVALRKQQNPRSFLSPSVGVGK
ncbi:hypothetical protein VIGAN_07121600 [Vigna angularis var. angularis]|uniref:Uncharacterized protein n=1 Tax=Vigna angularis var. angularis TaxID=157739 RepID=A0A0S3SI19_PHAAN|nr:hypothetical protein VIGAN_07121600 [Vigna angularis var. angularis]